MAKCRQCDGDGWYVVLGHSPHCDCVVGRLSGARYGNTTCPIEVQEQCAACEGTGKEPEPDVQEQ